MKGRASRRAAWEDEDVDPIDWSRITPRSGSLDATGQRLGHEGRSEGHREPSSEIGSSRRHSAYVIHCEIPGCEWESEPLGSVVAAQAGLLDHARDSHTHRQAESIDVRIRSRKYQFRVDVVPV